MVEYSIVKEFLVDQISLYELIGLLVIIAGAFLTIVLYFGKQKETRDRQASKTLWAKFDLLERSLKDYWTKDETRDYMELASKPIIQRIAHVDLQLVEIKAMIKELGDNK